MVATSAGTFRSNSRGCADLHGRLFRRRDGPPNANRLHEKKLKLAMALRCKNKHYRLADIRRDHFNATARACGLGPDMNDIIDQVVGTTPVAIEQVGNKLPKAASVFSSITAGLQRVVLHVVLGAPPTS